MSDRSLHGRGVPRPGRGTSSLPTPGSPRAMLAIDHERVDRTPQPAPTLSFLGTPLGTVPPAGGRRVPCDSMATRLEVLPMNLLVRRVVSAKKCTEGVQSSATHYQSHLGLQPLWTILGAEAFTKDVVATILDNGGQGKIAGGPAALDVAA